MGAGIIAAVDEVFPGIPDYICHFHFLRDIGKDLFQREHDHIRSRLRCHGIQGKLRKVLRQCRENQASLNGGLEAFSAAMKSTQKGTSPCSEEFQLYTLRDTIRKMGLHRRLPLAANVLAILKPVWYDQELAAAYKQLKKKAAVFDQLRAAMGIAEPAGKLGLNDPGNGAIHTIEARVRSFHRQLSDNEELQEVGFQKMKLQLEKYWGKLFADPIVVTREGEPLTLAPQRTNNILEQFFRDLRHHHCRKSGYAAMNKSITAMLSTTPLVKNLDNPEYYMLLLNGCSSLAERFSQIEVTTIQELLSAEKVSVQRLDPRIRKLVKDPQLPKRLMALARPA